MKKVFLSLIAILCCHFLSAQNPLVKQWDYRFGGTNFEYLATVVEAMDGGFVLAGYSQSPESGNKSWNTFGGYDYWFIKIDSLGINTWDRDYGGDKDDRLFALRPTSDGGYILGGASSSHLSGNKTKPAWDTINFTH